MAGQGGMPSCPYVHKSVFGGLMHQDFALRFRLFPKAFQLDFDSPTTTIF